MKPAVSHILAIDDDDGDAEILRRCVIGMNGGATFRHCRDVRAAMEALEERTPDAVFVDYRLYSTTGAEVVSALRAQGYLGPIIVNTGLGDEYIAAKLIRCGADDYIVKGDLTADRIAASLHNAESRCLHRRLEAHNRELVEALRVAKASLEAKNRRLRKMYETAHQFVDNVSHEFRTPMSVIKEFSSIIRDGLAGPTTDEQREYLDIVLHRVDDLATMVDDMLDTSKLEAGVLGVCRRACTVAEVFRQIEVTLRRKAASAKASLIIELDGGLPAVFCDPEKIGRVVINLVVNAVKFCGENGRVEVRASCDPCASAVRVRVSDSGPGIAPEHLEAIFERFNQVGEAVQSSTKGFGLGLNIARELVQLNFGVIEVQSRVGAGSTFQFTIPTADPAALMTRYLGRLEQVSGVAAHVALATALVPDSTDSTLAAETEVFLQHVLRGNDLLFACERNRWLIVAAADAEEFERLSTRVASAWRQTNRNRLGAPLPAVDVTPCGTWRVRDQSGAFIERFMSEYHPSEICAA